MADDENDFKDTINRHNKSTHNFPWFTMFITLSTELILYLYFNLIMKQWNGLFYRHTGLLPYLPYLTLLSLLFASMTIKKLDLGITLMALGVSSVIIAACFMFWLYISRPLPQIRSFPLM